MELEHVIMSYENYDEDSRLSGSKARRLEFLTTVKVLNEVLPDKGTMLDCAAGTGIYSFYYAERNYDVTALDITPKHVEQISAKLDSTGLRIKTWVNNAIDLSCFDSETFDVVLCMGPMYHLTSNESRNKCIKECLRVLKNGGILAVAYISRFVVFPYVAVSDSRYLNDDLATRLLETGTITHNDENCFWTDNYFPTPEEIEVYLKSFNVNLIDHIAADGISPYIKDKIELMTDEEYSVWCDYHYKVCREKSLLGSSNHGLVIVRK